eukprot:ANDGO_07481.mRNA.1 Transcription factor 25 homolog
MAARALRKQREIAEGATTYTSNKKRSKDADVPNVPVAEEETLSISPEEDDMVTARGSTSLFSLLRNQEDELVDVSEDESENDAEGSRTESLTAKSKKSDGHRKNKKGSEKGKDRGRGRGTGVKQEPGKRKQGSARPSVEEASQWSAGNRSTAKDADDTDDALQLGEDGSDDEEFDRVLSSMNMHAVGGAPGLGQAGGEIGVVKLATSVSIDSRYLYPEKELKSKFGDASIGFRETSEAANEHLPSAILYGSTLEETIAMRRILNDAHAPQKRRGVMVRNPKFVRPNMSWPALLEHGFRFVNLSRLSGSRKDASASFDISDTEMTEMKARWDRDELLRSLIEKDKSCGSMDQLQVWTMIPSAETKRLQPALDECIASGDPNALVTFVSMHQPYNVDANLRIASFLSTVAAQASDAIPFMDRALLALESAASASRFDVCSRPLRSVLPYDCFPNSRSFHIALCRHAQSLAKRACVKTALEVSKYLYMLDPSDPTYALLSMDWYAMRASAFDFIVDFERDVLRARYAPLSYLPNWVYAVPYATFKLLYAQRKPQGAAVDSDSSSSNANDLTFAGARSALRRALILYPYVFHVFLQSCVPSLFTREADREAFKKLLSSVLFDRVVSREWMLFQRIVSSFSSRILDAWKRDEEWLSFLVQEALSVSVEFDSYQHTRRQGSRHSGTSVLDQYLEERTVLEKDIEACSVLFLRYATVTSDSVQAHFEPVPEDRSVLSLLERGRNSASLFSPSSSGNPTDTGSSSAAHDVRMAGSTSTETDRIASEWIHSELHGTGTGGVRESVRRGISLIRAFASSMMPWNTMDERAVHALALFHEFQRQFHTRLYE